MEGQTLDKNNIDSIYSEREVLALWETSGDYFQATIQFRQLIVHHTGDTYSSQLKLISLKTESRVMDQHTMDKGASIFFFPLCLLRGVARIFQMGGHTVSKWGYSPDCHYGQGIVMAFSPPVVGCLVKQGLQKGGHGHPRTPPGYALDYFF